MRLAGVTPHWIQALVRGTREYVVDIDSREGDVRLRCTCPYAVEWGVCKHLWAVLRQTDDDGSLAPLVSAPDAAPPVAEWKRALDSAHRQMQYLATTTPAGPTARWPANTRLVYMVDLDATWQSTGLVIDIGTETCLRDGSWSAPARFSLGAATWLSVPDPDDRQIAEMLLGSEPESPHVRTSGFLIGARGLGTTLRAICNTGRCRTRSHRDEFDGRSLQFDDGPPWHFRLRVSNATDGGHSLTGVLVRPGEEMSLAEPDIVHPAGVLIAGDAIARFDHGGAFPLIAELRGTPSIPFHGELTELLEHVYALPLTPEVDLPDATAIGESHADPIPSLTIGGGQPVGRNRQQSALTLSFRYGSAQVMAQSAGSTVFDREALVVHHRQRSTEDKARSRLLALGAKGEWNLVRRAYDLSVPRAKLSDMVFTLAREGWRVEADGVGYRTPAEIRASVRSGIDWFDLAGTVSYGDMEVPLSTLLEARRLGRHLVEIADGTMGLLPTDWLERLGPIAASAESVDGAMRFRTSQLGLLDALLATIPAADVDDTFARARAELGGFDRIAPVDPPATFRGTLREYQREGLGWLHFLRRFELGGCLADDMGLGKTVQVLALLDERRIEDSGPSILVVPRSLVFNWLREAERFTPQLRMLDFSAAARRIDAVEAAAADVVITTYGTLRRDAALLAGIEFDYAVLDEAQAIKNAGTATAKACRLLRARHRLALSGTPIENRIEELWSLLEFLNPGMLGARSRFASLASLEPGAASDDSAGAAGRALLARALRPVILRRTKAMVAPELPERVEQTLEVELEPRQRTFYEGLRQSFQQSVLERVDRDGMHKSRMHILEAILRLRQAACHPVLVDAHKASLPSAKLDALVPALAEVAAEGHKALVFSQFTSLLALVRDRLDADGIRYEYLDGRTRDRQARVDRFQGDPECRVFLISLKAGGHGLNLTAADYVYLLDPWWNPAVEAQAIDRAHRIGQTRRVIATRLIARATIEEKILQLQTSKRALADAILTADKGVLASISRADLELLLR